MSILKNELSFPGGANKHLMHPWENLDLTFGDLKEIIKRTLNGTLDQERYVSEKPDGQNLKVTYKDGEIKAARNKETLENPMSISEISNKFEGREEVQKAFVHALKDLNTSFAHLSKDILTDIFDNGFRYLNLEIVYPPTKNVIDYYREPFIQLHGLFEYDCRWNVSKTYPAAGKLIYRILEENNATKANTFEIIPHNEITLKEQEVRHHDYFKDLLEEIMTSTGSLIGYGNTIADYYYFRWNNEIYKSFPYITRVQQEILINRWAKGIKDVRINEKNFKNYSYSIKNFEDTKVPSINKQLSSNLEEIFLELGVLTLKTVNKTLSTRPEQTINNVIYDTQYTVNVPLREQGDLNNLKIKNELNKFTNLGSHNSIVPLEGIVFIYKGNEYKLTGIFAPINQILGFYRYKR